MEQLSPGLLGNAAVFLGLALGVYAVVTGVLGALRHDARLQTSARYTAVAVFLALTTAVVAMEAALLGNDFSVSYVAGHSSTASPTWVKVVTLWAALEGSILLWAWLLSAYAALLALTAPNTPLRPWALVVMAGVQIFFTGTIALAANPFEIVPNPPANGPGPNPLLQNHWMMAVHPFLMYLGFVGLTVPFAYAMSALITRRPGSEWMSETRKWTLAGWGFLSAAIVAGGWWSYEVLGWGGYWAWDPVENVSFLPWLTATAFIHSIQVQQRRHMLKAWNLTLITLTFSLSILGTFLTRSGVLSSVHAFGDGPVGPIFLGFFLFVMLFAFGLLALRWDQVKDRADLDSPVSREGSLLLGNVFFLAMAFAVLLGTLFPLIVEAFTGEKVTVGAPFFDQVSVPIWLGIFALMATGPLLPWRNAEAQSVRRNLMWLAGGGVAAGIVAYALGVHKVAPLLTFALAGSNLVSQSLLLTGALRPRMRVSEERLSVLFKRFALGNRRRFGSMIVHFGVVVIALGVAFSGGYRTDRLVNLEIGRAYAFEEYELTAVDKFMEQDARHVSAGAVVEVRRDGRLVTTLRPRLNMFTGSPGQPIATPAVLYRPLHDVYLSIAGQLSPDDEVVPLRLVRSPLVAWIWVGGFIVAFGTAFALSPTGRRRTAPSRAERAAEGARA